MLLELLDRLTGEGVRYLEATVTPSNVASQRTFRALARKLGMSCREATEFPADPFPDNAGEDDTHDDEVRFRVGPFGRTVLHAALAARRGRVAIGREGMDTFERLESEVRSYCRGWPAIFTRAHGATIETEDGRTYLDFFAGAGALNYGHNNPRIKAALLAYLAGDGITHALDMSTAAKRTFLERFERVILQPRGLDYKVQFPGPTGTNAVEAALKLARKVTGRPLVAGFSNGFHGMTLGALAVTGNLRKRRGAGVPLSHAVSMPYQGFLGPEQDEIAYFEAFLAGGASGLERPAAVIVETVQAEGGINVASADWLHRLRALCDRHGMLMIVDDIQVGCGRTGPFFSFEPAGITPDIVCLSKSLSGYGLPFALTLMRRALDVWEPGEHNGTFRGFNPAFVTATAALDYWEDDTLSRAVEAKGARVRAALDDMARAFPGTVRALRGRGLIWGLECRPADLAGRVAGLAFARGLIIETAGPSDEVLKILPPLTIDQADLDRGLAIVRQCLATLTGTTSTPATTVPA